MAKLIVTRARKSADRARAYRILVDGQAVTRIGAGGRVEIPLPPGRHEIVAKLAFLRSPPLEIEAGPEGDHHVLVGSKMDRSETWKVVRYSTAWAPLAFLLLSFTGRFLFSDPDEGGWFTRFVLPAMMLPSLVQLALMVIWRHHILDLEEVAPPEHIGRWVGRPRSQPPPVRITIRGLMIAVAIVAVLLGAGVEWMRFTRRGFYQSRASLHSQHEATFRHLEQLHNQTAAGSPNASPIRQDAAKAAAMADYHAAMKRKYEEAAARRAGSVEPDPPAPPWP